MAKTLNTVSFTVLLIVLVMASTGFIKSEADGNCYNKGAPTCPNAADRVFYQECGAVPYTIGECECCKCCMQTYGSPQLCWAVVEGRDNHCHCYRHESGPCITLNKSDVRAELELKVNSSSRFTVHGNYVKLVTKD